MLIIEGSVSNGNGRLLQIRNIWDTTTPREIETLTSSLESPVNLTIAGQTIWITESRIRHCLLPGKEAVIPNAFFVRRFTL